MKNKYDLSLATEYMRTYGDALFQDLLGWYRSVRGAVINKDPDSVMEALTKVGMAKIAVHTNLNKVSIIFGKKDPCVRIPQLNKNHPLIHPWVKSKYSNKVANELLKEKKQIYGGVDFITGKVHGDFCDVPVSIFMPLKALKDTSVELECLVAATLHEIGHIFGMYAFMGRLFTTNLRLSSLHEKLLARDSGNHRLTIIAQTLEDINPKAVLKAEDLEKFEDQDAMDIAIISEAVNDSVSELGHNVYDHTSWEAIADEYAIKNGAEMWLPKMLDKVYDEQINISGRPLPVFLLFEIIKMLFMVLVPPLGILIILQDRRAPTYDAPEARFNRMRNALMESINLDETLSREDIQSLKDSIDTIDKIRNNYRDRRQFLEVVMWLVSKDVRQSRRYELTQRDLEDLANHTLTLRVAEFKTFATGA